MKIRPVTLPPAVRRPAFGRHGRKVVATLCGYELVALHPKVPVPTLSEIVKRVHPLGWALLALLAHHWYVESDYQVVIVGPV